MVLSEEVVVFLKTIVLGMGIGIVFDIFRIIRKLIPHKDILIIFHDILFCFFSGIYLFILIFYLNYGQIRLYILFGVFISNFIYMLLFSRYFINIFLFILNPIKLVFVKIRQKVE